MITKSDTKDTAKYHLRAKSVLELINSAELDLGTSSNPVVARGLAGGLPIPPPPPTGFGLGGGYGVTLILALKRIGIGNFCHFFKEKTQQT